MKVVPLCEADDEETFGGKASALARALRAGLPVPDGFAISWSCVDRAAAGDPDAIEAILSNSNDGRVAVRSSAIGEDSAGASFAGQHLTLLNVVSNEMLLAAIREIHASARSEGALAYRKKMGIDGQPRIAVVVIRMIDAETAGVLFTRNPVTGAEERLIEASWGLGEAVVSGLVTPDSFRISVSGQILERRQGRKDFRIGFAAGGGVIEQPVAGDDMTRLCLSDGQLLELHDLASRCERFFGHAQDLEWAFEGGSLYLLQSRPITVAPVAPASATPAAPLQPSDAPVSDTDTTPLGWRTFTGLALAALLAPLNSTIIAVALPGISEALNASGALVTRWMVTAYLVVSIIAQSPAGRLADLWGTSRVLTLGRLAFGAGALLAAFAPNLAMLGAGRIMMALGGALSIPTVFAQLRNSVPAHRRGQVFGIFGAIMGGAAAVGPLIGGFLTARFGWHSIFLASIPVVLASLALEPPRRLPRESPARGISVARFDFLGSGILAVAVLLLVAAVERTDALLLVASIAAIATFVWRELRAADPVLDVRLFKHTAFAAGSAIVALQNLAMYSMIFLLPFVLSLSGTSAIATGKMLLYFTLAMVLASPVGGRLSDAIGSRAVATSGGLIAASGAALFVAGGHLIGALIVMGVGIGISTSPSQAAALSAIPGSQAGVASGALSTMRYAGGVVGSGLVGLLVAGGLASDARLIVFPVVLSLSALVALVLPGRVRRPAEDGKH
ncbi:MAG TPA: MFS transporter [Thermoanaerobaculia bacterium]